MSLLFGIVIYILFLLGLPADTLSGHRDRFYTQYRTYVFTAAVSS